MSHSQAQVIIFLLGFIAALVLINTSLQGNIIDILKELSKK